MNQKNFLWRGCVLAGALALGASGFPAAWAQGPGSTGPTAPGIAAAVPLDGGASVLLAAGVGFGLRRLRQRRASKG